MDASYESKYHNIEKDYFWFQARRDMTLRLINKLRVNKDSKILEIGCSGGHLIKLLENKGYKNVYGIDVSKKGINLCKQKGIKNCFIMDAVKTRFKDYTFDLIIASDILEHIEKDDMALLEWSRILKPNGILIVFVPAFKFLWSEHDEINYHYRRYSSHSLTFALRKADFSISRISYWNFLLFFPVSFDRILHRVLMSKNRVKKDHLYSVNPAINKILSAVLIFENKFLQIFNFPFGVSVFAVAENTVR